MVDEEAVDEEAEEKEEEVVGKEGEVVVEVYLPERSPMASGE